MNYRTGIGYDIHRLIKGRKLYLGGVHIPYSKGLLGHSDADVVLHALCDALLGALNAGDIGQHFPDTDPRYKGIASIVLLEQVNKILRSKTYAVNNIDMVVILEEPKLAPFCQSIRATISGVLTVPEGRVSIKAKTNEGLGDIGAGNAIACYAVATITKKVRR